MKQITKVFKFGGASIKDADGVRNVTSILKQYKDERLMIIVSAMGKVTNALEEVINAHAQGTGQANALYEGVKRTHYQIMDALFDKSDEVYVSVNDTFVEAEWVLEEDPHSDYDYMYDQIIGIGELVSSKIVAAYLNKSGLKTAWVDARDIIKTDEIFREATVNWADTIANVDNKVVPLLDAGGFAITQGFIGSTNDNATTSLGREGSDYSAAIFSYCLDAESMTIWKDVPGVLTADPRLFDNVSQLYKLSYKEAIEMTYYGARVIHPKTIKPLQNKNIPLHVKSFINPGERGTVISSDVEDLYPPIVVVEPNQTLLNISTKDFSFVAEHHLGAIFNKFAKHHIWVNMMKNTAINFIICSPNTSRIDTLVAELAKDFHVEREEGLELVTVRHSQPHILEDLKHGKIIMLEDSFEKTVQMVLKVIPALKRKEL